MPTDNVAESDLPDDVDPSFRLKYLEPPCQHERALFKGTTVKKP